MPAQKYTSLRYRALKALIRLLYVALFLAVAYAGYWAWLQFEPRRRAAEDLRKIQQQQAALIQRRQQDRGALLQRHQQILSEVYVGMTWQQMGELLGPPNAKREEFGGQSVTTVATYDLLDGQTAELTFTNYVLTAVDCPRLPSPESGAPPSEERQSGPGDTAPTR